MPSGFVMPPLPLRDLWTAYYVACVAHDAWYTLTTFGTDASEALLRLEEALECLSSFGLQVSGGVVYHLEGVGVRVPGSSVVPT